MIAALILAGGHSRRFGEPKLVADLAGLPLGLHAARTLGELALPLRFAVCGPDVPDYQAAAFTCLPLTPVDAPQSRSLALGVAAARLAGASAVLVALADMPLVPLAHFEAMLAGFDGRMCVTRADGVPMPPALFGAAHFAALESGGGDRGARALLAKAPFVALDPGLALDVDTPADLARAASIVNRSS